ncbi:hypothetical protein DM02DRAFT_625496 [Periconia macrospinosa]|uniref:Uncharacterized protein n=1 Tax=Periconia macrospinosa TaxID=97972 RepID=A0A2V1E0X3_9PLEO|nr:hypothetical protein DM02DRAFT_625496 [Periconia macrospinosa]
MSRIRRSGKSSRRSDDSDPDQESDSEQELDLVPDPHVDPDPLRYRTKNRFLYPPLLLLDFFIFIGKSTLECIVSFLPFAFWSTCLILNFGAYCILRAYRFLIWTVLLGISRMIVAMILTITQYLPLTLSEVRSFVMFVLPLGRLWLYFNPEDDSKSNLAGIELLLGKIEIGMITGKKLIEDR